MAIDDVEVRERLVATLHAVADQTAVDDPPVNTHTEVVSADTSRRPRRWPAVLVAAGACIALLGVTVVFGDGGDQSLDTTSPTSAVADSVATVWGLDAHVIPPEAIDTVPLASIHSSWRYASDGDTGDERWSHRETTVGQWRILLEEPAVKRAVTYRYSTDEQIRGLPEVWIGTIAPARLDLDDVADASGVRPAHINAPDGLALVDLGVVCPAGENPVQSMQGWPSTSCARRAIGTGNDFVIELVLPVEIDLDALISQLRVGTLDELRNALEPVEGLDQLGDPPTHRPSPDPVPPPDTPFCNAWLEVLSLARAGAPPADPEMIERMDAAAQVAPAELAAQIRDLATLWSTTSPEATPGQDSASLMMDVTNATWAECPGISDPTGD